MKYTKEQVEAMVYALEVVTGVAGRGEIKHLWVPSKEQWQECVKHARIALDNVNPFE